MRQVAFVIGVGCGILIGIYVQKALSTPKPNRFAYMESKEEFEREWREVTRPYLEERRVKAKAQEEQARLDRLERMRGNQ